MSAADVAAAALLSVEEACETQPLACAAAALARAGPAAALTRSQHLLAGEPLAAYERMGRRLADIHVEEPGTPPGLNQTKLAHVQCSVDVAQAAAYLGAAVVWIEKAVTYEGYTCPDETQRGCTVSIATAITASLWVTSYLSLAASSCAATLNAQAACAADVTAIMANLGEVATAGSAAADDCLFEDTKPAYASVHRVMDSTRHWEHPSLGRRLSGPAPLHAFLDKVSGKSTERTNEERLDLALCTFDAVQSASYLIRVIKQIMGATIDTCADQKVCTINLFTIISSFAWLSQFLSFAAADCASETNQAAYCAGDISDLIAATTNFVASGMVLEPDCGAAQKAASTWAGNEVLQEVQETKRRLAAAEAAAAAA